jgi:hypothetical protein
VFGGDLGPLHADDGIAAHAAVGVDDQVGVPAGHRGQGPGAAEALLANTLDQDTVDWLKSARKNLDRRPNYILAAYMASGT